MLSTQNSSILGFHDCSHIHTSGLTKARLRSTNQHDAQYGNSSILDFQDCSHTHTSAIKKTRTRVTLLHDAQHAKQFNTLLTFRGSMGSATDTSSHVWSCGLVIKNMHAFQTPPFEVAKQKNCQYFMGVCFTMCPILCRETLATRTQQGMKDVIIRDDIPTSKQSRTVNAPVSWIIIRPNTTSNSPRTGGPPDSTT